MAHPIHKAATSLQTGVVKRRSMVVVLRFISTIVVVTIPAPVGFLELLDVPRRNLVKTATARLEITCTDSRQIKSFGNLKMQEDAGFASIAASLVV